MMEKDGEEEEEEEEEAEEGSCDDALLRGIRCHLTGCFTSRVLDGWVSLGPMTMPPGWFC